MHAATIFFALAAVASASAVGVVNDLYAVPQYRTSYSVSDKITGDQKSASEVRDGGVTKGSYSLVQPDGVVRTVKYIVTPGGGFQAQVLNNGVAAHPAIIGVGKGAIGAIAGPGLAVGGLGLGLGGARSVVGGLGVGLGGVGLGINNLGVNAGLGLGAGLGINNLGIGGGWGIGGGLL